MKPLIKVNLLFLFIALFSSCGDSGVLYKKYEKIKDLEWKKGDQKTFVIHIDDNRRPKEMVLTFRYATGYQFDKVFLKVTEINPQGERTIRDVDFLVRDEKGQFIGEKGFDIIDLEYVLASNKEFPTHGDYTYIIEHAMPQNIDPLHFVMEVGLILKEQKQQ